MMTDLWMDEAATLPLAFAQVREDPLLDLALAEALPPGGTVVMIASGGDTAAMLARLPLSALHMVDVNAAQLALTKLKLHLAGNTEADHASALLGHRPLSAADRARELQTLLASLDLPADALGPPEPVAAWGPDHAGRYERTFAALREELAPHGDALRALLETAHPEEAGPIAAPGTPLGDALDAALATVMSLPNLVRMFGAAATQNPARPFHEHFTARIRVALHRMPARSNPFLWQMLAGTFPPGVPYDWLQPGTHGNPLTEAFHYHHGAMVEVLRRFPQSHADLIHLSNILDWLSPAESRDTLQTVCRVLKPGGAVIIRQLNSTLDIPESGKGIRWDLSTGAAMEREDRSFFYPRILVGRKS